MKSYICGSLLLSSLILVACESILDKEPLGLPDATTYYDSKATYMEALTGVYDQLHAGYVDNHRPGIVGDAMSDDVKLGPTRNAQVIAHYNYAFDAQQQVSNTWEGLYQMIALANVFLEKVSDNQDDLSRRARGEAYFLRGYAYHELARWFGRGQIFTTNPTNSAGFITDRSSSQATWGQAMADLRAAEQRLPATYTAVDLGRVTKGAALGYMAKTKLYQQQWDSVTYYIDKLNALNVYKLAPDYGINFQIAGENNEESVLEVQSGFTTQQFGRTGEQNNFLQHYGPRGLSGKIGFSNNLQGGYEPTLELFNLFAKNDKRIKACFVLPGDKLTFDGQSITAPASLSAFQAEWSSTGIANIKWVTAPSTFVNANAWNTTLNWKLMRYAEVLLMQAEAANELGANEKAVEALNKVRVRAGLNALTTVPAALRDSIRTEYRRELEFEGHRFFNLVRWKTIPQAMIKRGFVIGKHELYPIPQAQRDRNPMLSQNPGW